MWKMNKKGEKISALKANENKGRNDWGISYSSGGKSRALRQRQKNTKKKK